MYIQKAPNETRGRAYHGPKLVLAAFMLIAMVLIASLPTGAIFSKLTVSSLTWSPTKPQPGDNANAYITVTNTGSAEVKIKWIGIHFDWQSPNSYVFDDRTSSPVTIVPQGQYVFILLVPIPVGANFTVHPYSIKINYDSESSQYSESSDTNYDFTLVKYVPPVTKSIWENQLFIVMIVLIVVAVLLVVVMVAIRQRRLAKEAAKKHPEMRSALTANSDAVDYELARTVTKEDRSRATRVDHKPRHWEPPKEQRIAGDTTKPPIYRFLGKDSAPQQMPKAPPQAQPMAPPTLPPPQSPKDQTPKPMPAKPPPMILPGQQSRGASSMLPKEQATLHQCPICGRMNKASDTTCPKCGGTL